MIHFSTDFSNLNLYLFQSPAQICDLGCGNGVLLGHLHSCGFLSLTGLDYSSKSIDLCSRIHSSTPIKFLQADILSPTESPVGQFDVLLDKGTYDAIALMPNTDIEQSRRKYKEFLERNLMQGGRFVLMSCNFTLPEVEKFLIDQTGSLRLEKEHVFDMPTLRFGGAVGQQVVGVVFQRTV